MLEYMRTVLNGLKAWVTGEVNKLLSKIDNDIAALRKTLDEASSNFVINATTTLDRESVTLDKTFAQIKAAIQEGKSPVLKMADDDGIFSIPLVASTETVFVFAVTALSGDYGNITSVLLTSSDTVMSGQSNFPTFNSDGTMPQMPMAASPTEDMEIATKKYVDEHAGGVTTLHINVTAINDETMEATFTADKTPTEMQQAVVNGPVWCVVTFAAGLMGEGSVSFGVPPAWYWGAPAFGGLVEHIHSDAGNNEVGYAIRAAAGFDSWIFDIRQFGS